MRRTRLLFREETKRETKGLVTLLKYDKGAAPLLARTEDPELRRAGGTSEHPCFGPAERSRPLTSFVSYRENHSDSSRK